MVVVFIKTSSRVEEEEEEEEEGLTDEESDPIHSSFSPPHQDVMVKQNVGEPDDVFERRRRAFYAKRSYYKKRRLVGELEQQRKSLEFSRAALQTENARLKILLEHAQWLVTNHSRTYCSDKL